MMPVWFAARSAVSALACDCTGCTTRPRPTWAQITVVIRMTQEQIPHLLQVDGRLRPPWQTALSISL